MAVRVVLVGNVPEESRRELCRLADDVEIEVAKAPQGPSWNDPHRLPDLVVLGAGAEGAAAAFAAVRRGRVDELMPILALSDDPSADLVLPSSPPEQFARVLKLLQRLLRWKQALDRERRVAQASLHLQQPALPTDAFLNRLDYEFARAIRFRHPVSLITLGMDGRERMASTYGDDVVRDFFGALEGALRPCVRDVDLLFRPGDYEIAAILPETSAQGAGVVATRLALAASRLVFKPAPPGSLFALPFKATPSVGVADGPREGIRSSRELLAHARECEARSREAGGGRVIVYGLGISNAPPA